VKGFATTSRPSLEILSAYAAGQDDIESVAATPGWQVVGAFYLPVSAALRLELIGSVSVGTLTMRTRLVDLSTNLPISGTEASTTSTTETRSLSPIFELTGARSYQIQVEVTGGTGGFGTVRSLSPTV